MSVLDRILAELTGGGRIVRERRLQQYYGRGDVVGSVVGKV
jgi:hypothetical protein